MLSVPEHSVLKSKLCVKYQRYITARDNQIEATNDYTWPRWQLYHHSETKRNYCPSAPLALALSCSALLTVCLLLVAFLFCLHKHIQLSSVLCIFVSKETTKAYKIWKYISFSSSSISHLQHLQQMRCKWNNKYLLCTLLIVFVLWSSFIKLAYYH